MAYGHRERTSRIGGCGMRMVAVLPVAVLLTLALATEAHADDQSVPLPLMLGKSAVIPPDTPDATVPAEVVVTTETAQEIPANTAPQLSRAVISATRALVRQAATQVRAPAVEPKAERWYHVAPRQYRPHAVTQVSRHSGGVRHPARVVAERDHVGPSTVTPEPRPACRLRDAMCLHICDGDTVHNVTQNGRWIVRCISSPPAIDRLHRLLLDRVLTVAQTLRLVGSARQYHCLAPQYQSKSCASGRVPSRAASGSSSDAGSELARNLLPERATAISSRYAESRQARREAEAVTASRPEAAPHAGINGRARPTAVGGGAAVSATRSAAPSSERETSGGWFVRSVLVLMVGAALAAFFAAAPRRAEHSPSATLSTLRFRLGSRGLSTSRISLGDRRRPSPSRDGPISYRD